MEFLGVEARDEVEALLPFMCEAAGAEMCDTWKAPEKEAGEESAPKRQLNFYSWGDFCKSARKGDVHATVVIDFPYADEGGLNLESDDRLLERMYVFKDESQGDDKRVVMHVHTPRRWVERGGGTLQERVKHVTSVNVRHAQRAKGAKNFVQEQGNLKMPLVPLAAQLGAGWRDMWRARDGSFERKCTWLWGKAENMPSCEDTRVAAKNYDQVRKIIKLGEGEPQIDHVETLSWAKSEDAMRGGASRTVEYEVVAVNAARVDPSVSVPNAADRIQTENVVYRGADQTGGEAASAGGWACPDAAPEKFVVLFVGANIKGQDKMELEREQKRLWVAFKEERGLAFWRNRGVEFVPDTFARVSDVVRRIGSLRPTVVHVACHGVREGLCFTSSFLGSTEFADFLFHHNDEWPQFERVRLVIVNACKSGEFAKKLTRCVDFSIGHGDEDVMDVEAILFTDILYQHLGQGRSLLGSFLAACLSSGTRSYTLFCRVDPKKWCLVSAESGGGLGDVGVGTGAGGDSFHSQEQEIMEGVAAQKEGRWLELVKFLAQHGLGEIAHRLRECLGVDEMSELGYVSEVDVVDFEWLKLVKQRKLVEICQKVAADRMSAKDMPRVDGDDSLSAASGADTMEILSDSYFSSDDESVCENTVVAVRNEGDLEDLAGNMQRLAIESNASEMDYYFLLLVEFVQGATFLDPECKREWCDLTNDADE
ncbi:hypothetical protein T484DRAFT_2760437 [Baffinella frigidus]|nr:hypothetical protein T484DRAFT_2760437 [Cryptophyta sp. CCMP2293]